MNIKLSNDNKHCNDVYKKNVFPQHVFTGTCHNCLMVTSFDSVCLSVRVADSCTYHPGQPVFHDALKGWSCCKKRSTDFTEFLNTPVNVYCFHKTLSAQHRLQYCINGFTELFYIIYELCISPLTYF